MKLFKLFKLLFGWYVPFFVAWLYTVWMGNPIQFGFILALPTIMILISLVHELGHAVLLKLNGVPYTITLKVYRALILPEWQAPYHIDLPALMMGCGANTLLILICWLKIDNSYMQWILFVNVCAVISNLVPFHRLSDGGQLLVEVMLYSTKKFTILLFSMAYLCAFTFALQVVSFLHVAFSPVLLLLISGGTTAFAIASFLQIRNQAKEEFLSRQGKGSFITQQAKVARNLAVNMYISMLIVNILATTQLSITSMGQLFSS